MDEPENWIKVVVDLSEEQLEEYQRHSDQRGQSVESLLCEALAQWLERQRKKP
jgi:hypothetical protein